MLNKLARGKRFDLSIINLIVFACFVSAIFSANDDTTLLLNCIVLLVMYAFLRKGIGRRRKQGAGLYSLRSLTRDLEKAAGQMQELEEHIPEKIRDVLTMQEDAYESDAFKATIKEYYDESDALVRRGKAYYNCNIADYVNEDLLNKVGNTAFNDFLSGVMTGLGILGTFVGLAIGLQSFRTDSAAAMTDSIAPLIEGIKVAFYTSIFGVLLSLVYGTLYKYRLNQAEAALEEFVSLFYRYGGYRPENEAVSRLLQLQEEQTDSMNQFAEEISIALADAIDKALTPTLTQLPEQMAQTIQNSMVPTMEALNGSIHTLAEELTQNLTQAQNNGVETIVNQFLDQMNQSVGGQMANLEKSIQTICEWQETTSEKLGQVVDIVCENAASVVVINEDMKEIVGQLATYIATMDASAEKLLKSSTSVDQLAEKTASAVDGYKGILDEAAKISEQINRQQKEAAELAAKQSEHMRADSEFIQKQSAQLVETCEGIAENFNDAAEQLATVSGQLSNDMSDAMTRTYEQFDSQLATAITHFSGTLAELRELVEKTPKIVDALSVSIKAMKDEVADYLGAVRKSEKESAEAIQHSTEGLTEHIQKLDVVLSTILNQLKQHETSMTAQTEVQAVHVQQLNSVLNAILTNSTKQEESNTETADKR